MVTILATDNVSQPLIEEDNYSDDEWQLVNTSYFSLKKTCFTENYLVFSLNERLPQMTEVYLDKEDDVLDYCKKVVFTSSSINSSPSKIVKLTENNAYDSLEEVNEDVEEDSVNTT